MKKTPLPVAYDAWDKADLSKTAMAITTRGGEYMRRGQMVIFEYEQRDDMPQQQG